MAFKIVTLVGNALKEILVGIQSTSGVGDANKPIMTDSGGKLHETFLPSGVGVSTKSIEASEALSAGNLVNVYDDSGLLVRKADASTVGKEANGYVLEAVESGQMATVYFDDELTGLSALTPGARYFLSTTPGQIVDTPPTGSGNVYQSVGKAVGATSIIFEAGEPIERA